MVRERTRHTHARHTHARHTHTRHTLARHGTGPTGARNARAPVVVGRTMTIDADLKALATSKNFAALSTLSSDGQPRTHIMWIDADDDHLVFNTEVHRAKFKDVNRDPRVTISVFDAENPYRYIEARGRVVETVTGPAAKANIDALAQRYMGVDEYPMAIESERVIVKVAPERLHKNGY